MSETTGKRIVKNTGLMVGGKSGGAVFNLLVLVIVGRTLSLEAAGMLFILHAFMLAVSELCTFKSWQALIRFGVGPLANRDKTALHQLLRFTMGLDLAMAVLATLAALMFLSLGGYRLLQLEKEFLEAALIYSSLIIVRQQASSFGVLRLLDRFDLLALHAIIQPFARCVGAALVWYIGGDIFDFITVWFVAAVINTIVLWGFALRELSRAALLKGLFAKPPTLKAPEHGLWAFSWMANLDSTLAVAKLELPVLLAGAVLGPAYAAVFKIAQQIASVLVRGTQQLDEVIYPELARLVEEQRTHEIWPLILRTGGALVGIAILVGAIVGLAGPDVLSTALQADYRASAGIAFLLLIAASISAAYTPLLPTLYAAGHPERALIARGIGVMTLLILFVGLGKIFGGQGPAWAFIIGDTLALIIAVRLTRRTLDEQIAKDQAPPVPDTEASR